MKSVFILHLQYFLPTLISLFSRYLRAYTTDSFIRWRSYDSRTLQYSTRRQIERYSRSGKNNSINETVRWSTNENIR